MRLTPFFKSSRGDTIIEVLFAVTIFSMIAVGSLSIMNQSISTAQRSLEITLVRQQMDAQAETLRFINQAYIANFQRGGGPLSGTAAEWTTITSKAVAQASTFGASVGASCPSTLPTGAFIINSQTARVWNQTPKSMSAAGSPPFSQVRYNAAAITDAYGIWIEAVRSGAVGQLGYIDFHIRTCWNSPGSSVVTTLGTIVRLYEPR